MERAMSDVDFDRIIDAVRKEIAMAPVKDSLAGLRVAEARPKTADDKRAVRRHVNTPMVRVRRVGEGQKRYR
jgi:hypothetical protein